MGHANSGKRLIHAPELALQQATYIQISNHHYRLERSARRVLNVMSNSRLAAAGTDYAYSAKLEC